MCLLVIIACTFYIPFYIWLGFLPGVLICIYGAISALSLLFFFRKTGRLLASGNFFTFTSLVFFTAFGASLHGLNTTIASWISIVPLTAYLLANARSGFIWTMIALVWVVVFYGLGDTSHYIPQLFPKESIPLANAAALIGFIAYISLVAWYFESIRRRTETDLVNANAEIAAQKDQLQEKNELITAINHSLEDLVTAKTKDLEEKNEELDTFLYQSSHALRRPVARASGLVNLIKPGISPQEMEFIRSKTELTYAEMDKLLRKLVLISEVFQRKVQWNPMAPSQWIPDYLDRFSQQHGLPPSAITLGHLPSNTGVTDIKLLEVVLFEILHNCLVYTAHDEAPPQIHLSAGLQDQSLHIMISDKGMGIQEAFLPQVFKLFSRGTVRGNGAGLGLYLAKNALNKIQGKIRLESTFGAGTEVSILLPTFFSSHPNNPQ